VVLASASPRRREILHAAGVRFRSLSSRIQETPPEKHARRTAHVRRLALAKGRAVLSQMRHQEVILAADTIVCVESHVFGKPSSSKAARQMLRALSGRWHQVISGMALLDPQSGLEKIWSVTTRVKFRRLSEEEIHEYVMTGEPFDKAGAYAIQGRASNFVKEMEGSYFNVVGLPIESLAVELSALEKLKKQQAGHVQAIS
jgi:septum formation protein